MARLAGCLSALFVAVLATGCGVGHEQGADRSPARGLGKADTQGTCLGHCDGAGPAAGGCWCDTFCFTYGDCCDDKGQVCDGHPPPRITPPTAPTVNDPSFTIQGARTWYLIPNELTAGDDPLQLQVEAPEGTAFVDAWIDDRAGVRLRRKAQQHSLAAQLEALTPGEHQLLLAADGSETAFARLELIRSHPLYVVVTNDWDDPDNPDATLERQERLHADHPELRLTHFVGPYTFTDPSVSESRASHLVSWLKRMRDDHGDEIGLHIHPYCSFVQTTSVPCRSKPSFSTASGDPTGYTVMLSSYSESETSTLLQASNSLFVARGLGRPTSFRAGGWTAEIHTLRALAKQGFVADGSGCNWARLEEWKGYATSTLYDWNKQNWSTIGDTSQPYYPDDGDILKPASPGQPHVPLLEVPDNGLLVDYVTAQEMVEVFEANWPGGALAQPRVYSIGYHPPNFSEIYLQRMDGALDHVDHFLHSNDAGPVVYATMSEMGRVWAPPEG